MAKSDSIIFITPWSDSDEKASMDKYAFQMASTLKSICNIEYSVLSVNVHIGYIGRLLLPLITCWRLFFCKEKIIYVHYAFFINFFMLLPFLYIAKHLCNKKIVLQIHEYRENLPYKRIIKYIDLLYCNVASLVIVHNTQHYNDLIKKYTFEKIYMFHMPIDEYHVSNPLKIQSNINLLMHGGIIRKKGYEDGIKSLAQLPNDYTLTIIGGARDVGYLDELYGIIKKLNIENRVKIVDKYLSSKEYNKYIEQSDIIIYPYKISTASAALAEGALKFEKPFFTSNLDAFIDYLETEEYSFISGDEHSLVQKILNLDINKSIHYAQVLKHKYSWKESCKKLGKILESL